MASGLPVLAFDYARRMAGEYLNAIVLPQPHRAAAWHGAVPVQ
jgi:hypothetical protein